LPEEKIITGGEIKNDINGIFKEIFLSYKCDNPKKNKFSKIEKEVLILVTGSLYLVGEIKKMLISNKERRGIKQWLA
jgi:folylpolyglutamate synthase/dihydropteroate synthase